MALGTPWYTSDDLIDAVKRKMSLPISQVTFSTEDILMFANEEMMISQVPAIMQYHEEFFVTYEDIALEPNKSRYPIPDRAIGRKLRDLFYVDSNENLYEMTRIGAGDKAFFQSQIGGSTNIHKFYVEGDDIVLSPQVSSTPTGSLRFYYFQRPNQLVPNDQAAIISTFCRSLTVDNSNLNPGDTFTIGSDVFTAVVSSPASDEFAIGITSIQSATNLVNALSSAGYTASNGSPSTAVITLSYNTLSTELSSSSSGIVVGSSQGITFSSIPSIFVAGVEIDWLQTKPGHRIRKTNVILPAAATATTIFFDTDEFDTNLVTGDYMCLVNQCIIPMIPTELHNGLAERVCARITEAQGDQAGLAAANLKLQDIARREGNLIENRTEGAPLKISQRKGMLSFARLGPRRRVF